MIKHRARLVVLSGLEALGTWEQLEIVMIHWWRIEALLDEPGPLSHTATRTRFERLSLATGAG